MKMVTVSEIAEINPRIPKSMLLDKDRLVDFVPMANLLENGLLTPESAKPLHEVIKGYTYFENGDVIVAKITPCMENGKAGYVRNLPNSIAFGSTEFHVLRPEKNVDPKYLFYMIWSPYFRNEASANMTGTAGQQRVPASFFDRFHIPLPSLEEQKRIVDILDKADSIRRKRREAVEMVESFSLNHYLHEFGSPLRSQTTIPLSECVTIVSGGTPSKQNPNYWSGEFPWVSPKDMKVVYLSDSEDHINECVFEETSLKKLPTNTILIVIRGMILAHTVPITINRVPVSINQDMKGLIPNPDFQPEFLLWSLKASHDYILSMASNSAHGTKRIEMEDLIKTPIPKVSKECQERFVNHVQKHQALEQKSKEFLAEAETLFNSLVQQAFRGEL